MTGDEALRWARSNMKNMLVTDPWPEDGPPMSQIYYELVERGIIPADFAIPEGVDTFGEIAKSL